ESERDELKSKLSEAQKAVTKATKAAEDAAKKAADTESAFNNTLRDQQLTESLTKAGVTNPVHLKAAKALLAAQVSVVDDNGSKVAKAGDKALGDFITEWAGGDEGKHFVAAPDTTGGGSHGGHRNTTPKGDMGGSREERAAAIASRFNIPQ
ncbi:MAG TPA: hypothetical protein VIN36_04815, partial [Thiobacillus sp.]